MAMHRRTARYPLTGNRGRHLSVSATNRGGRIDIGTGDDADFTPVEFGVSAADRRLHLGLTWSILTSRRAEPEVFRGDGAGRVNLGRPRGHHLADIEATFQVLFLVANAAMRPRRRPQGGSARTKTSSALSAAPRHSHPHPARRPPGGAGLSTESGKSSAGPRARTVSWVLQGTVSPSYRDWKVNG